MLLATVVAVLSGLAPVTTPPGTTEPAETVSLDAERQDILDDLVSLGIMQDQPLDPDCLGPVLASFPDSELDALAAHVLNAVDVEISDGGVAPFDDPLSDAEIQLMLDSLVCISGDADVVLVDEALVSLTEDEDFAAWNPECVRATLSVLPDEMLEDVADADDPDELQSVFSETLDDARADMSDEDVNELFNHLTALSLCAPEGRELLEDLNAPNSATTSEA